jgi:hypothetical protein
LQPHLLPAALPKLRFGSSLLWSLSTVAAFQLHSSSIPLDSSPSGPLQ